MDVLLAQGPCHMAAKLATYIKDPSTIRAHVLNEYGRGPSLDFIKEQIERAQKRSNRHIEEPKRGDGEDYAPTFRSNRIKPVKIKPQTRIGPDGVAFLVDSVGEDFDVVPSDMRGPSRFKAMFHARSVVVRLLKEQGWSYPRIGGALGGRNHSTVIGAYHMFETYAQRDPRVLESYLRHKDMMEPSNATD